MPTMDTQRDVRACAVPTDGPTIVRGCKDMIRPTSKGLLVALLSLSGCSSIPVAPEAKSKCGCPFEIKKRLEIVRDEILTGHNLEIARQELAFVETIAREYRWLTVWFSYALQLAEEGQEFPPGVREALETEVMPSCKWYDPPPPPGIHP
jgi:hypothetical protein